MSGNIQTGARQGSFAITLNLFYTHRKDVIFHPVASETISVVENITTTGAASVHEIESPLGETS